MRTFIAVVALLATSMPCSALQAQVDISVPASAKFVVQVDIGQFRATRLGGKLLKLTERLAREEIGSDSEDVMEKMEEALGFNPLEEVQTITLIGSSFEDPEEDLQAILRLKKTTGNLEGMMLALPGYDSEDFEEYTIHAARDEDNQAYLAIHTSSSGDKTVVAATKKSEVLTLLSALDAQKPASLKNLRRQRSEHSGRIAEVQILALPEELSEFEQGANVAKLLNSVSLTLTERGDDFAADVILTTSDEKKAEQIQQLAQGLKAMVGLFKDEIGDDEEARMAISLLEKVSVEREGPSVSIHAAIPEDLVIDFLREEADLDL